MPPIFGKIITLPALRQRTRTMDWSAILQGLLTNWLSDLLVWEVAS